MPKQNQRKQKSNDEYRRDIFTLKNKIKQQQSYLDEIKQKCSQIDIFSAQSYSFQMKIKILENDLAAVKQKIFKYSKDQYNKFYQLNFCAYALSRACFVIGISPEMIFRAVDMENKKTVKSLDLANFFRQVLRLDSTLFNPILSQLDPKQQDVVQKSRFQKFVKCFMIDSQKVDENAKDKQKNEINDSVDRVCLEFIRMEVQPNLLWNTELVNIATTAGAIKNKIKSLDNLDCVAVYCRCDPTKQGAIQSQKMITMLQNKISDIRKFKPTAEVNRIKLKQ